MLEKNQSDDILNVSFFSWLHINTESNLQVFEHLDANAFVLDVVLFKLLDFRLHVVDFIVQLLDLIVDFVDILEKREIFVLSPNEIRDYDVNIVFAGRLANSLEGFLQSLNLYFLCVDILVPSRTWPAKQ